MGSRLINLKYHLPAAVLAFLYFFSGKLSLLFLHGNSIVNIGVFAAEGIALAFILYFGKRVWIGIFIGQFILALSNDITVMASLSISAINSIEALVGYALFKRFKLDVELKTFRDIFFLVGIILSIQLISASFSNVALVFSGIISASSYLESSFSWWFGNVMGQLLVTPFLLLLFVNYHRLNLLHYLLSAAVFAVFIYILEIELLVTNVLLLLSFSMPVVVFIISKRGFAYGTLLSVVVALVSSYSVYIGDGPFYIKDTLTNVINYNLFVLAHISIAFVTGVLFEERKRHELSLQVSIDNEVKKNKEQQLLMLQQSRFAQMGEMISMIAHQWRQPLNNLALVNQLLITKYQRGKLDEEMIEHFKVTSKRQIDQMSVTIDDFRNFFRQEKTKIDFCINDVIDNVLEMTKSIYANNNIGINFEANQRYISNGYPNELGQAIINIINNAKDALIEKEIENKFINIELKTKEEYVVISIEDSAGGIPEDIIDNIFDPYFTTKSEKNGTGLGLYMTKMIIQEQLEGTLMVRNSSNGARFEIQLKREEY